MTLHTRIPSSRTPGWSSWASTSSGAWPWTRRRRPTRGIPAPPWRWRPWPTSSGRGSCSYDPRDPEWPDRDRFVLSNGHASILQYSLLHLTGYDLSLDDLRQFRQWGSRTPGHPEFHHTAGVEVTTGPLGQGVGNAVGMAIAERWLRTTFGREVCDHRTFVFAGDGCFMEGISHEAASLAGHLGLGRLLAFYDDNHITIDGPTELAYDDNVPERFEAYGWRVRNLGEMANDVDGLGGGHPGGARGSGGRARRQADPARAAQPHRVALAQADRHRGRPREPLRRRRDPGDQGDPGPARRTRPSGCPTRCAQFYGQQVARGAELHAAWSERFATLDGRPRRLGRRAGRPRPARVGRRAALVRGRHRAGHPARRQQVHRRHGGPAARAPRRFGRPHGQQRGEGQGSRHPIARRRPAGSRSTTASASTAWGRS